MQSRVHRIGLFVFVGAAAAAVHFGVVKGLVDHFRVAPLLANIVGWLVAFGVSFWGIIV